MNSCHAVPWVLATSLGPLFPLGHVPTRLFQGDAWRYQLSLQDLTQDPVSLQDPVLHLVMVTAAKAAPHIHIPASSLLLVSTRSSSTSFLTGLSTTCVRKLTSVLCRSLVHCVCSAHPAEMGVAGTTHKNQDVWLWGSCQLSVKGFIHLLPLIWCPVTNTPSSVTLPALFFNPNPEILDSLIILPETEGHVFQVFS